MQSVAMALITTSRFRNSVMLVLAVSMLSSCVRHETVCECVNYHRNNGERRKHYLLAKRIKMDDAKKICDSLYKKYDHLYDYCRATVIK